MFTKRLFTALPVLTIAAALSACGGGGSAGSAPGEITSVGVISGFGSVIVHNKHYDASNAQIVSADTGAVIISNPTDDQLKQYLGLGQVVALRGTSSDDNSGIARSIRIDDELVGPVDAIDHPGRFIKVNGQIVTITDATIIDDSIIEAARGGVEIPNDLPFGDLGPTETLSVLFSVNMVVEVSGFPNDTGILATRIEDVDNRDREVLEYNIDEFEVKGMAKNKNVTDTQFEINGLTVTYDASVLDDNFGPTGLEEGQFVEVKGTRVSVTEMTATSIELEDGIFDDDFQSGRFEIESVITEIRPTTPGSTTGPGMIVIGTQEFHVNDISLFMVGQRIEIKGSLDGTGSVRIDGINDESEDTVRIEDTGVLTGNSFTTRLGLTIVATERTRLEVESGGNRVEARGFPVDGNTVWTRIKVEVDANQECRLRGPVTDKIGDTESDFSFKIQGVMINVAQVSDNNFEGSDGLSIGRPAFFDQLVNGDVVQATADAAGCNDGILTAREVEFENRFMGGDDNGVNDNELVGPVSIVTASTFVIASRTITVNNDTLIDDSMIELVCSCEIPNDLSFVNLPDGVTLTVLLAATSNVKVLLNGDIALSIEDF